MLKARQGNATLYQFERDDDFRSRGRARADLEKLISRLGLDLHGPGPYGRLKVELEELVVHCHLAIAWYQRHRRSELWLRRLYFFASLLVLFAIPLLLQVPVASLVSALMQSDTPVEAPQILPQVGGLLTGILAFWRGMSGWLDKRQMAALYAKAAADLKTLLYQFEQKWDDISKTAERLPEFEADLEATIAASRRVVEEERLKHYETASYPTLDIASIIKASTSDATGLVTHLAEIREAAVKPYRQQLEARIQDCKTQLDTENKVYAAAFASSDTRTVNTSATHLDAIAEGLRSAESKLASLRYRG